MKKEPAKPDPEKAMAMIAEAIKNGTHGPAKVLCQQCRQWVSGYYHRRFDGSFICYDCTPEADR